MGPNQVRVVPHYVCTITGVDKEDQIYLAITVPIVTAEVNIGINLFQNFRQESAHIHF